MPLDGPPVNGNARLAGMPADVHPQPDGPAPADTAGSAPAAAEPAAPDQSGPAPPAAERAGQQTQSSELGAVEQEPRTRRARTSPSSTRPDAVEQEPRTRRGRTSPSGTRPDVVTWLISAAVFAAYTVISVFRYLRRDPTSWDLGIFTEYVKQYGHLRPPIVDR